MMTDDGLINADRFTSGIQICARRLLDSEYPAECLFAALGVAIVEHARATRESADSGGVWDESETWSRFFTTCIEYGASELARSAAFSAVMNCLDDAARTAAMNTSISAAAVTAVRLASTAANTAIREDQKVWFAQFSEPLSADEDEDD